jgi:hypothetical protein
MAEEKHHHHLFHHRKEEESSGEVDYEKKEKHHKHMEQLGEFGAIAAGAYALVRTRSNFFDRSPDRCIYDSALDLACIDVFLCM